MKTKGARNKKGVSRQVNAYGYIQLFKPNHPTAQKNGYVMEHRMIAYDEGLLTDLSMEVHHKNGRKDDNRPENFEILTKAQHTSITWTGVKRAEAGQPCRMCPTKTRSRYGLCQPHYKLEWQRGNIYENPELLSDNK